MAAQKWAFVAAVGVLAFAGAACKINKDANCLNPKASCYKKDTEAPTIVATNPESSANAANPMNPTAQSSLSSFTITFSEPMKNADQKSNYPNPTGSGSNGMTITSVGKMDDRNYQVILNGTPSAGNVTFDLGALTDLSDNRLANSSLLFKTNGIQTNHSSLSASGFTDATLTWQNDNTVSVNWEIKKGGSSCATAAPIAGAGQNGTNLAPGGIINTTINFSEITPDQTSRIFWVCQTATGINVELNITLNRDDTAPVTTATPVTTNALGTATVLRFPATVTLSCSDNYDQISYTIDGSVPPAFPVTAPNLYPDTGITLPLPTAIGFRDRTVRYRCRDRAGNVEATEKVSIYKAELQWSDTLVYSERWDWAYWK